MRIGLYNTDAQFTKLWASAGTDSVLSNTAETGGGCFPLEFSVHLGVWFCPGESSNVVVLLSILFSLCMIRRTPP